MAKSNWKNINDYDIAVIKNRKIIRDKIPMTDFEFLRLTNFLTVDGSILPLTKIDRSNIIKVIAAKKA